MSQSPFRYPGAKNKVLPILMEHIDKMMVGQNKFCDLFIGGGSVLLEVANKYPKIELFCNDKDPLVSSFWRVLADVDLNKLLLLFDMIEVKPTIEQFYKLRETLPNNDIERAYRAIYFNRTCFSGILHSGPIGGKEQKSQYKIDCRYNFNKLKKKILNCRNLIYGRTKVSNIDFSEYEPLIKSDMPIYIDPPYFKQGKALYPIYMIEEQHIQLAKILKNRSNWLLSYDDAPQIKELYKGNQIIDLASRYSINGYKNNWAKKNELIILC